MDEQTTSGVGVLDKAALVLGALEAGPATLAQLVSSTGLARPTAHRLAVALEYHRMVARDMQGRFILGPRLQELSSAAGEDRLLQASMPVLQALRDHTKESSQLFRRQGDYRVCVAASEREMGLRDSIPVGATLSMSAGSAAQVLLAWEEPDRLHRGLYGASFNATAAAAGHSPWASENRASRPCLLPFAAPRAESLRRCPSRAPSTAWAASPGDSTAPPSWPRPIDSRSSSPPSRMRRTCRNLP